VTNLPAPINVEFSSKHLTKAEKDKKQKAKASVTPRVKLKPPNNIKNNVNYYRIWKETLKLYDGTDLLNALDTGMLERYCIEKYDIDLLYKVRNAWYCDTDQLGWTDTLLKIEGRVESKTKTLNQMALALYMTPRARAGAIPNQPDKETEDPNAKMFD
jgi:phage terminase small subunit